MSAHDLAERRRIVEALLDLCFERGYQELDLAALLQRAGLDEAAFHRHFGDLEDCFCAVFVEARDHSLELIEAAMASETSWRDRLRAAAYAFLRFLLEDERVTRLSVVEVHRAGQRARRLFAEAFERIMDLFDEGRGERPGPDALSRATAQGIGAAIFARIQEAVASGDPPLREEAVPELMYAAVLPYLGPDIAAEELSIPPPRGAAAQP